ncbi:tetratricopeptide repeat protein, partial [Geitlerinema sp. PCC 9228]|uniref:tetratricopeptide repeat protein n=1 Tax=Geitlerinema sp. PCC 9228 TaxID=111611 RepID=UPI000ACD8A5C
MLRRSMSWIVGVCLVAASPVAVVAQSVDELHERGDAAQEANNYEEAARIFREIIERAPNDDEAYFELGYTLRQQGKLEEAIANYRQALQINPDYAVAYNNLGYALQQQGKLQEAVQNYRQAIQSDPD